MRSALLSLAALLWTVFLPAQQPTRPAITGIAFMRVYTADPTAAQKFYGQTLGFARHEADGLWIYPVNKLQWIEVIPHAGPDENHRLAAVGFITRDAAGLQRYVAAHDIKVEQPLHNGQFSVRDPEGNLIIFVQSTARPSNKSDTPGSIAKLVADAPPSPNATSQRLIHVGFIVHDPDKEAAFWSGILGFKPYWRGGRQPGETDWISQQVPNGTDWLEFMLRVKEPVDLHQSGMSDHFSLGEEKMADAIAALARNGCNAPSCSKTQFGHDGKVQLNLFDPDQTRVEFMEFKPTRTPCCSEFTGPHPDATEER